MVGYLSKNQCQGISRKYHLRYLRRYSTQQGPRRRLHTLLPVYRAAAWIWPLGELLQLNGWSYNAQFYLFYASFCLRLPVSFLNINALIVDAHFQQGISTGSIGPILSRDSPADGLQVMTAAARLEDEVEAVDQAEDKFLPPLPIAPAMLQAKTMLPTLLT